RAGQRAAERTTGTPDSRPAGAAAARGTRAVLRLPVVRVAASAASTNT
ncbi:sensor histidine kinase, partial [Burkholderia cepacia]